MGPWPPIVADLRLRPKSANLPPTTSRIMKWTALFSLVLVTVLQAADARPPAETCLDPARAGRDYADQGEYKNDWGAAQVIALGDDNFRMVTYRGGLPGAGWDKEFKQETPGKRQGDKIVFTGANGYR